MLVQKCGALGSFKYQLPDITEYLEILGNSGFSSGSFDEEMNDLVLTAKMMRSAKILVKEIDIKIGKKSLESYDDMLRAQQLMPFLLEFVGAIQGAFNETSKKK